MKAERIGSVRRGAIVAAAVVASGAVGFWVLRPREEDKGNRDAITAASAARQPSPDASTGGSSSPLTAMAICRKMEGAGIVGRCEASSNPSHAPFDGVAFSIAQGASGGMLVQAHDAATYGLLQQNISTGYVLRFDGPRVIVQVDNDIAPDVRAKIKPLLEGLLGQ